jgi:hypothetical protein
MLGMTAAEVLTELEAWVIQYHDHHRCADDPDVPDDDRCWHGDRPYVDSLDLTEKIHALRERAG